MERKNTMIDIQSKRDGIPYMDGISIELNIALYLDMSLFKDI